MNLSRIVGIGAATVIIGIFGSAAQASSDAELAPKNVVLYKQQGVFAGYPSLSQSPKGILSVYFVKKPGGPATFVSPDGGRTWSQKDAPPPVNPADRTADGGSVSVVPDGWIRIPREKADAYQQKGFWTRKKTTTAFYLGGASIVTRTPDGKIARRPLPGTEQASFASLEGGLRTRAGVRLQPLYGYLTRPVVGRNNCYAARSEDDGATWRIVTIAAATKDDTGRDIGFNETALEQLPDGRIVAMMRSADDQHGNTESEGSLYESTSADDGKTWTAPVKTPIWGYPANLLVLKNGDLLCTYGYRRAPFGVRACLSHDGGATWDIAHEYVLRSDGISTNLGYPKTKQNADGSLCTLYYITNADGITHIDATLWRVQTANSRAATEILPPARRQASCAPAGRVDILAPQTMPVLFNEDGDFTFVGANETEWRENLHKMLAPLPEEKFSVLAYSLATGSDVLLYPSKAGSSWGWQGNVVPERLKEIRNFPTAVQAGMDGVRWAADDAKAMNLGFVPVFRMNDAHYTSGQAPFLEGEFWSKNKDRFTFSRPPLRDEKLANFRQLLDFSHEEVRAYRLGVIREAIYRYADTMNGLMLDFMRHPLFFPPETARRQAPLMTDLMVEVRAALNAAERRTGHKLPLIVRVPPDMRHAQDIGLDVGEWARRGLVQVIIPGQAMTLAQDTPLEEYLSVARPAGVRLYASILDRTSYTFAFRSRAPQAADYAGREPTSELLRGAAINFHTMGAAGFETYNFDLPLSDKQTAGLAALAQASADWRNAARTYAITPSYIGYVDEFESSVPKQLPARLEPGKPLHLRLYIGEPPAWSADPASYSGLRIGFAEDADAPRMSVSINGIRVSETAASSSVSRPGVKKAPRAYRQWTLPGGRAWRQGWNEIVLRLTDPSAKPATVAELQAGFLPGPTTQTTRR